MCSFWWTCSTGAMMWMAKVRNLPFLDTIIGTQAKLLSVIEWLTISKCGRKQKCPFFQPFYEGCPESIQPFWISWEPVMWPWCNLAASQRRPYCTSCPVGLVNRQWDGIYLACELCECHIHKSPPSQQKFLALGKARSCRDTSLGCRGANRPGWCDAWPKKPAREL